MAFVPRDRISVLCTDAYHIIFNAFVPKFFILNLWFFYCNFILHSSRLNKELKIGTEFALSISIYICINHCIHELYEKESLINLCFISYMSNNLNQCIIFCRQYYFMSPGGCGKIGRLGRSTLL